MQQPQHQEVAHDTTGVALTNLLARLDPALVCMVERRPSVSVKRIDWTRCRISSCETKAWSD